MSTAYFFSGFDPAKGFTSEIANNLKRDFIDPNLLLFIASTPSGHEKSERYANGTKHWFEQAGICFKEHQLIDDRVDIAQALDWTKSASCIYLLGGDTLAQISFIEHNGLIDAIRNSNAVIMGLSAGAINMAKTSLCSKDSDNPETVMYEGIGVADMTIEPHFSATNSELISELKLIAKQRPIYAMCDDSAIIVRGDLITYLGEIYRVHHMSMERIDA